MSGALLDTHALIWLYDPAPFSVDAILAVDHASQSNALYVSPISAWEIGAASRKKNPSLRPQLRGLPPEVWFLEACVSLGTQSAPITEAIGLAASTLPGIYGYADPGDCLLIATAHVHGLTLLTRDRRILEFARRSPNYLTAVCC
jgi:PIN domain nuclease of toxin-antitoxin system